MLSYLPTKTNHSFFLADQNRPKPFGSIRFFGSGSVMRSPKFEHADIWLGPTRMQSGWKSYRGDLRTHRNEGRFINHMFSCCPYCISPQFYHFPFIFSDDFFHFLWVGSFYSWKREECLNENTYIFYLITEYCLVQRSTTIKNRWDCTANVGACIYQYRFNWKYTVCLCVCVILEDNV